MAWTAQIVSVKENPVPYDVFFLRVKFSDGDISFDREYKVTSGMYSSPAEIEEFLRSEVTKVSEVYALKENVGQTTETVVTENDVPKMVTNFQARAVLLQIPGSTPEKKLFDDVDAYVKNAGGSALQAWEYANHFYRDGELINSLGPVFGLSSEQIDDLFRQAALIEA